ncbi:MAG: glycosyltransferase [Flavobacteriales bacterium]|nr:glycosyltransferase [Flavobacteriales bacterium]
MRILFPLNSFYPTTMGGPGTILYWQAVYLNKNGCSPIILTTTNGITKDIIPNQFIDLPCGKVYYGDKGMFDPIALKILYREVLKADIIHLTSLFSTTSILSFLIASLFTRKSQIVWSVRGELNSNALMISKLKKSILLGIYKIFTKEVTFASTSPKETLEIKSHFTKNSVIELANVMPASTRLIRNVNNKRFLYLGRIHPIKNIESLIQGFYQSHAFTNSDVFLDITGKCDPRDMSYLQTLKNLVFKYKMENKVRFLGHIAGREKEELLSNAYFLVLPSHTENFGNVVIESLNQGTPVITSKYTPWQELEKFKCGFWVNNNSKSLADIIDYTIQLPDNEYVNYRSNSIKFVNHHYNIDIQIHKWIYEYSNLLKKNDE